MDVNKYISSGILEEYVLGAVSTQEKKEVDCLSHIYPEIRTELDQLEIVIENFSNDIAVNPPTRLKTSILDEIDKTPQFEDQIADQKMKVVRNEQKHLGSPDSETNKTIAIPKDGSTSSRFPWLAAASIIGLLLVSSFQYFNNNSTKQDLALAIEDKKNQETELASLKKSINDLTNESNLLNKIKDPSTRTLTLKGTDNYPNGIARVFWNEKTDEVFFQSLDIPTAPSNKQYQLWAIVDGTPVDIGLLSLQGELVDIQQMKAVKNAGAFAVTLEKIGGSPSPNLEAMYLFVDMSAS